MSKEVKLKFKVSSRGFSAYEFTDLYGTQCQIHESSLATNDAVWLGPLSKSIKVTSAVAQRLGIPNPNNVSHVELGEDFSDAILPPAMHLSKEHAKTLITLLQRFVDTGGL